MNAKTELLNILAANNQEILCAEIGFDWSPRVLRLYSKESYDKHVLNGDIFHLPIGYTEEQLDLFLSKLDVDYDSNKFNIDDVYIYGIVWCTNDSFYLTREDSLYPVNTYWKYRDMPKIPECLKQK